MGFVYIVLDFEGRRGRFWNNFCQPHLGAKQDQSVGVDGVGVFSGAWSLFKLFYILGVDGADFETTYVYPI